MKNPTLKRLNQIIKTKKTRLCVSADVTTMKELLKLATDVGSGICLLKIHSDIITDFNLKKMQKLVELARKHNFLLFEDRKFADIGQIVQRQYHSGIYKISDWADIVTIHALAGEESIKALKQIGLIKNRAAFVVAEMSCVGTLAKNNYTKQTIAIAQKHKDFVIGIIAQKKHPNTTGLLIATPGINLTATGDKLGQQYITPTKALQNGTDIFIVGRGITSAPNPKLASELYRAAR